MEVHMVHMFVYRQTYQEHTPQNVEPQPGQRILVSILCLASSRLNRAYFCVLNTQCLDSYAPHFLGTRSLIDLQVCPDTVWFLGTLGPILLWPGSGAAECGAQAGRQRRAHSIVGDAAMKSKTIHLSLYRTGRHSQPAGHTSKNNMGRAHNAAECSSWAQRITLLWSV